ncbi:class I SAM-dependent methyltransferase [Sutcliffiella halmapala]|uniref:class I SAM-dependent methyltransferase n=1 Tax=Sutcliffiella halmapala TaxID=79882 RepID=UPI0009958604|nr:class I SAM-dependent methyltransferase [Sutcliffiella halmapala]
MIDFDNLEGYRDTVAYDSLNKLKEIEERFFVDLAQRSGGPILDIACGTGRLTIPLAKQGYEMTGVDIIPETLEAAKKKALNAGVAVRWIQADVRQLELQRRYKMIFTTGNSFQHFLDRESQEGLLRTVYNHLEDDGVFTFETRNPILSRLAEDNEIVKDAGTYVDKDGNNVKSTYKRSYDHKNHLEYYTFTNRLWKEDESDAVEVEEPFVLRYFFPQELESFLYYNGFTLEQVFGNFDKSSFQADSPLIVCVCRKRSL